MNTDFIWATVSLNRRIRLNRIEVITSSFCGSLFCCSTFVILNHLPSVLCRLTSDLRSLVAVSPCLHFVPLCLVHSP
jgi:hypothetical protein